MNSKFLFFFIVVVVGLTVVGTTAVCYLGERFKQLIEAVSDHLWKSR